MRAQQKPRSDQAAPEAGDLCAYFALSISGRCRELCRRNDPPVPLVQRREELPFRRRQLMPEPTLEDKREVLPIHPGINVHQIRGGDFCAARRQKRLRGGPICASASVTSLGGSALPFLARSMLSPDRKLLIALAEFICIAANTYAER
jgi:hypothetical protein